MIIKLFLAYENSVNIVKLKFFKHACSIYLERAGVMTCTLTKYVTKYSAGWLHFMHSIMSNLLFLILSELVISLEEVSLNELSVR